MAPAIRPSLINGAVIVLKTLNLEAGEASKGKLCAQSIKVDKRLEINTINPKIVEKTS